MPRKVIKPAQLDFQPRPTYPYSPGACGGNMVYTAGQVAWGSDGNVVGIGDIEAQTRQTLSNVGAVLTEGGASWDDVLKCNVYLKDMKDFQKMNDIFAEIFPKDPPARTTVQTPMAEETMLVEIEAIAYIGD
jgi:2-iminobutanoate/2-iminopropanoate deaminase